MSEINLIMPMGGKGSRFFEKGFSVPKPLIEISGKPFFYWAVQSVRKFVLLKSLTFVVLQEHVTDFSIDKKILETFPEAKLVIIPQSLNGAVLTCMEGVKELNNNSPLLFNDCDQAFYCPQFYQFCSQQEKHTVDGALLSFRATEPKYSFLLADETGKVLQTVEKQAISDRAICGSYYFTNKTIFIDGVNDYLNNCDYNEFFMSGVYNSLIARKKNIQYFSVEWHLPFGVPEEYVAAKNSNLFKVVE